MNRRFRFIILTGLAAALLLAPVVLPAKVGRIKLQELVRMSDVIAIVRVESVQDVNGLPIAKAVPEQVLKGQVGAEGLYFVAGRTWECDISTAVVGERVLVFLDKSTKPTISRRMLGMPTVRVDLKPLYFLGHSGRGRMPLRQIDGVEHASLWASDLILPRGVVMRTDSKASVGLSIRSVRLSDILAVVTKKQPAAAPRS